MSIEFFPLPMALGLVLLAYFLHRLLKQGTGPRRLFIFALFWVYMSVLLGLTLFPLQLPLPGDPPLPVYLILTRVNMLQFHYADISRLDLSPTGDLLGNILATVPFGFLLPLLQPFNFKKFIWYALGLGIAIELSQLLLGLLTGGSTYRITDITDVLLNAFGALTGYACLRLAQWVLSRLRRLSPEIL